MIRIQIGEFRHDRYAHFGDRTNTIIAARQKALYLKSFSVYYFWKSMQPFRGGTAS